MQREHDPRKIKQKMDAGLTREQAVQVLDQQAEYDGKKQFRKSAGTGGGDK